ncbi:MAG: Nif3-like dinuclear metal center hexameric protein [Desulfobacteraceae bacterium]|nr:Nif3-like dinuclear metal center hexameric protein [Desulfobacteraceae bacterium]
MNVTVADVLELLETVAPPRLAESWDNIGLQAGDRSQRVRSVWVALDPLPDVVAAACAAGVDLLITHHPLLFRPLSVLDLSTPLGRTLQKALTNGLSIAAAHTNLDSAAGGLNDVLAARLGLKQLRPLAPAEGETRSDADAAAGGPGEAGMGRIGVLPTAKPLADLARDVRNALRLQTLRWVGDGQQRIGTVAVCSGSGSGLMQHFYRSGADVFISGDLRYHDARDAQAAGKALIDVGHFASEHLIVEVLAERLTAMAARRGWDIDISACDLETDPFALA